MAILFTYENNIRRGKKKNKNEIQQCEGTFQQNYFEISESRSLSICISFYIHYVYVVY